MINANELVVGRWFNLIGSKGQIPIQIDENIIRIVFSDSWEYALNDFHGILLTPEVLLSVGFEKRGVTYDKEKLYINLPDDQYPNGRTYYNSWCIMENSPQYLHQLMNLTYALTGKELIYKP